MVVSPKTIAIPLAIMVAFQPLKPSITMDRSANGWLEIRIFVDFVSGGPLCLDDKLGLVWNLRLVKYSFSSNQTGFGLVFDAG